MIDGVMVRFWPARILGHLDCDGLDGGITTVIRDLIGDGIETVFPGIGVFSPKFEGVIIHNDNVAGGIAVSVAVIRVVGSD